MLSSEFRVEIKKANLYSPQPSDANSFALEHMSDDLREIDGAASKITILGEQYREALEKGWGSDLNSGFIK